MAIKNLMVRSVDAGLWQRARSKAINQGLNMGQVLNALLKVWVNGEIKIKKDKSKSKSKACH